ncbi:3-deoxy-manno-octulosonate cytidylyltransferase [Pelagibacteraceae bacterium]|nr:3-deoxy-manno-octulosonate cytidylyltransferase [Pelagibacteraceae bacterium]
MKKNKQYIVIPARMSGSRLPGKPLIKILGKEIIFRVWERCALVHPKKYIYIITEDKIIEEFCLDRGINCYNTGKANSAIDRVKLFADKFKADTYINVQGDEPVINIKDIKKILKYSKKNSDKVIFGKTNCNKKDFYDFSKAKVVCDKNGKLLYSSRAGIPLSNKGDFVSAERAIWIYSFNRKALIKYYNFYKKAILEKIEDNEIIRFLEADVPVYCINMIGDSWAVDEKKDLDIVKNILLKK